MTRTEMVGVRLRRLNLSQVAAGRLTGGGHHAFSRYERGEAASLPARVGIPCIWFREEMESDLNSLSRRRDEKQLTKTALTGGLYLFR